MIFVLIPWSIPTLDRQAKVWYNKRVDYRQILSVELAQPQDRPSPGAFSS